MAGNEIYARQVFINCPFSDDYRPLFEAIVFAVAACGFRPRCALEADDGGEVRVEKVARIIRACRFGIHDISFMELDEGSGLARLNMAFELGLFLGAKWFGTRSIKDKLALILDQDRYRYQKAISDIAGQDIRAHGGEVERAIRHVRDWLSTATEEDIPGGAAIAGRYREFAKDLPSLCVELKLSHDSMTFADLAKVIVRWLKAAS